MVSPERVAAVARTVQRAIAVLEATGIGVDACVSRAMALACGKATKADLRAARAEVDVVEAKHRRWNDERGRCLFWVSGQASNVLWMAISREDHGDDVLRQLAYGLPGDDGAARDAQVQAWYREAMAGAPATVALRKKKASPGSTERLAAMARALGAAAELLEARGARIDPKKTAGGDRLAALLAREGYPAHPSVLAFESVFGGLLVPADEVDHEDGRTLIGAWACLRSKAHVHPDGGREGLVPVAYTSEDGVLYLDADGKAYFEDTIADAKAAPFAPSGAAAVAKLLRSR